MNMNMKRQLHDTLFELIGGLQPTTDETGLVVDTIEITAPVTVSWRHEKDGLCLLASPPETIYRTGIEPVVQPITVTAISSSSAAWPETEAEVENAGPS